MARLLGTRRAQTRLGALALLVFACSVYEEPDLSSDLVGGSGTAGSSSQAGGGRGGSGGVSGNRAGDGGGASGSTPVAGGPSGGTGGTGGGSGGSGGSGTTPQDLPGGAGGAAGGVPGDADGGEAGAPPIVDNCPSDPNKLEPGTCGCGIPDVATATLADCTTLKKKLVHRYDFEGSGTVVTDRVGTAHGSVKGTATLSKLNGKGVVVLEGGLTGSYVDLPNKLVSTLTNATIEAWVTWGGGDSRQRVFDFGDTTNASPEDNPGTGHTYFFATPKTDDGVAAIGFSLNANTAEDDYASSAALPTTLKQVVVVANDAANTLSLYVDGVKSGGIAWTTALSSLNDVNVWLGRSQWDRDPEFGGTFHEFRIYNAALTDAEIATAFKAGTDPSFLK